MMQKHKWAYEQFGWSDVTPSQRKLFEQIELDLLPLRRDIVKLIEADLSSDQIGKIFTSAEEISRDKGLRTGFGKAVGFPKDTMIKINKVLTNFGEKLQNSGPVKNADQKFEELKASLRSKLEKNPKGKSALGFIDALGSAAKSHPKWQGAIIGVLTALSALALGPAAIPVVAAVLRGAAEIVKGEKLSTAVGKGLYAGALGYLGAQIASAFMGWFEGLRIASISPVGPRDLGFEKISFNATNTYQVNGMEWTRWFRVSDVTVDPAMRDSINGVIARIGGGDPSGYDQLLSLARRATSSEYLASLNDALSRASAERVSNDAFLASIRDIGKYVTAAAGGAATAAADIKDKKPATTESTKLTLQIMEGLWADLTLKFGAGRLKKAWMQAGRPTDSVDVAQMLAQMGMDADDIKETLTNAGVEPSIVDQTMKDLVSARDDDVELPFVSGIKSFDDEAKKIFKSKGKDEFIKYWESKVLELEKDLESKTKSAEKPSAKQLDGPALFAKIQAALNAKDSMAVVKLLGPHQKVTSVLKQKILLSLDKSPLGGDEKEELRAIIKDATVAEQTVFNEVTRMLKEHNMSWKQLGYQLIIKEPTTGAVVLI
jgi:hypothetical protein